MPMLILTIYHNFSFVMFEVIDQVATDKKDRNRILYLHKWHTLKYIVMHYANIVDIP